MMISDQILRDALDPPERGWRSDPGQRDAAIVVPWFTRGGRDFLLYTARPDHLPEHPGEVSFPGGGREGDEDALACALRELNEEVGLVPEDVEALVNQAIEDGKIGHCRQFINYAPDRMGNEGSRYCKDDPTKTSGNR